MAMDLAKKTFQTAPDYLIAGTNFPIMTEALVAAEALTMGAPVKLDSNGKAETVATTEEDEVYGIAAEAAEANGTVVVYLSGEFFADALDYETSVTADTLKPYFRKLGIYLR